jgi:hypothetical protein
MSFFRKIIYVKKLNKVATDYSDYQRINFYCMAKRTPHLFNPIDNLRNNFVTIDSGCFKI